MGIFFSKITAYLAVAFSCLVLILAPAFPVAAKTGSCLCSGTVTPVGGPKHGGIAYSIKDVRYYIVKNEELYYSGNNLPAYKASKGRPVQYQSDCDLIAEKHVALDQTSEFGLGVPTFQGTCTFDGTDTTCGTTPCSKSDKACSTNADCQGYGGLGMCIEKYCYFDSIAQERYRNQPSLLGVKADLKLSPAYKPIIRIPGLSLSDLNSQVDQEGYVNIPWLGQYIATVYKFGIAMGSTVAAIMIILQGVKIIASAGGEAKSEAYQKITHAVVGLILLWGSYALLYTISPDLVSFKTLRVKYVEREDLKLDDHSCDDPKECPETKPEPMQKGACQSNRQLAETNRRANVNFEFFGKVDGRSYGQRKLSDITMVVIHNGGHSAKMNNDTWQKRPAAAHYTIEQNGTIFQHAGEECVVPHAPGGNKKGIGIEINIGRADGKSCNSLGSSSKPESIRTACTPTAAQYESLRKLLEDIASRTGFTKNINTLVGHCELVGRDGHGDPRAFDWAQLGLNNEAKKAKAQGHACSWYLPF